MRWALPMLVLAACDESPAEPPTTTPAALGRLLFYDPILSADGQTACATCHSEIWGMSDGLPKSIGVGGGTLTGPGREGPNVLTRNAPSLWNVGFRSELMWDGRQPSLEDQVLMPMHASDELALAPDEVVARLSAVPAYVVLFDEVFDDAVRIAHIQTAVAAFERTLVSDQGLWDAWRKGDEHALTAQQKRGAAVFETSGCGDCHVPPLFESNTYARRRVTTDIGRMAVTQAEEDRGAFRTPSLRNVRSSGPYFHDGSVVGLDEAVASELDADAIVLDAADRDALVSFIGRTLIDVTREPDRPNSVPSGLPVPEDGFRIFRP